MASRGIMLKHMNFIKYVLTSAESVFTLTLFVITILIRTCIFCRQRHRLQRMETDPYNPFDQNLIKQLNNKIVDEPVEFPDLITTEINDHHPEDFFPEGGDRDREKGCYVLTPRHLLYGLTWLPERRARNGYWKPYGYIDGRIFGACGKLVAVKQSFTFYEPGENIGRKTDWNMTEYRLLKHSCTGVCDHTKKRLDSWVLCKIYWESEIVVNQDFSDEEEEE